VGDEGGRHRVIILRQFDCVSALPRMYVPMSKSHNQERERERELSNTAQRLAVN
jgi:hypothetical protein